MFSSLLIINILVFLITSITFYFVWMLAKLMNESIDIAETAANSNKGYNIVFLDKLKNIEEAVQNEPKTKVKAKNTKKD